MVESAMDEQTSSVLVVEVHGLAHAFTPALTILEKVGDNKFNFSTFFAMTQP